MWSTEPELSAMSSSSDRMEELESEKRSLEARRERLELPAIDKEMLKSIVDNFEKVMSEGPIQKKSTFSAGW